MRSQTWKSCLGVLCLMAAGTANAAKISFSEKGFVDVGALIQAQYRITQDGAGSGSDPSNDFLLRRARILLGGQFNENIGFFIETDISYGAVVKGGPPTGANADGVSWNNNLYLLDALATYKVSKALLIDAGLMLLPNLHNPLTSGAKFASVSLFPTAYAPNSQRGTRDVGVELRGLLLDDRLYYRLGVFNGEQTIATTPAAEGINPGDAPRFAGTLRFNIAGKEDGYAFCQVCFAKSPIVSIGVLGDFQTNSVRTTGYTSAAGGTAVPTGMTSWTTFAFDVFADIPFSDDLELSVDIAAWRIWAGSDSNLSKKQLDALVSMRFGVIGPFVAFDWAIPDGFVYSGNAAGGWTRAYHGGLSWYVLQNTYKVTAEFIYADREVGNTQWQGFLQFQVGF